MSAPTSERRISLPWPHRGQREVLDQAQRFNVLACGRRWGKTHLASYVAAHAALDGKPVAWFAPSYKLLAEAWRELTYRLLPVASRVNGQEHRLELITGGAVEMWTLERPDPARGRKYALAIIDEAAMVRDLETAWSYAIRPTLIDYQGSAWFLSTPKGKNDFYSFYARAETDFEWMSWRRPSRDNPHIPPEELEAARASMPEIAYRQEMEAEFLDVQGAVFRREWLRVAEPPPVESLQIYQGVDLAISTKQDADSTAIVTVGRDRDGRIWVLDSVQTRAPFHQVLQLIQSQAARWKPARIAIEAVQYQAAVVQELLRTTTLPVFAVKPDKDKLARALPLVARYEQGLVWHSSKLPRAFEDELSVFPLGEHDDQVDALVYAWSTSELPTLDSIRQLGW